MLDTLILQVPLKDQFVMSHGDGTGETDVRFLSNYGINLAAGSLSFDEEGNAEVSRLSMPYSSIPSSNSTLAFKLFQGSSTYWPYIELNASAAKLYQGHNVYFTDDLKTCSHILLSCFIQAYPDITDYLDFENTMVKQLDVTYSAHVKSDFLAKQVIHLLHNLRVGQLRPNRTYDTAVMFNAGSSKVVREIYLKEHENLIVLNKLKKALKVAQHSYIEKQIIALQAQSVEDFSKGCIRFEAKTKKEWFKRRGIPTRLKDMIKYFQSQSITDVWRDSFQPILDKLEGTTVNIYDDEEVLKKLKTTYVKINPKSFSYAKALRLYRFFISIKLQGFDIVKRDTPSSTFFDNLSLLTPIVPELYLKQFATANDTNVIPLFRVVNVDFENQLPANWVEPQMSVIGY